MPRYTVPETEFASQVELSPNVLAVAEMFGLGAGRDRPIRVMERCEFEIEAHQVVYITGGSGAGKSVLLRRLAEQIPEAMDLNTMVMPCERPLVDCFEDSLEQSLYWLSMAGLSDAFAILRSADELSEGQRYRFRLALALAKKPAVICIDEFCALLDRVTAGVVAHNVRKFADRFGTTFIVATSHDDILEDLRPDVVAVKHLSSQCDVYYPGRIGHKRIFNADCVD